MLQLQMIIPSLRTDASVTATLKKDDDVLMDLETVVSLPETSYQQKAVLKYGNYQPSVTSSAQKTDVEHSFICMFTGVFGFFSLQMMIRSNWN